MPGTALRDPERSWEFKFLVTAEKDGDVAYVGSDWNEGIAPWAFGLSFDLTEARAAPARVGLRGPRRVPPRRGGAPEGRPPPRHPGGHRAPGRGHRGRDRREGHPRGGDRQADGVHRRVEQRGLDAEAARRPARPVRGHGRGRRPPRSCLRQLPGGRVPPPGLPRRREPRRRVVAGRGRAQGRDRRPVPVRRADGRPPGALDVHPGAALRRAARRGRRVPPRALRDARRGGPRAVPARAAAAAGEGNGPRRRRPARPGPGDGSARRPSLPVPARGRGHRPLAAGDRRARVRSAWTPRPGTSGCGGRRFSSGWSRGRRPRWWPSDLGGTRGRRRRRRGHAHAGAVARACGAPRAAASTPGRRSAARSRPGSGRSRPRPRRRRCTCRSPPAGISSSAPGRPTRRAAPRQSSVSFYVLGAGLHGLGALRPQPDRPRAREEDATGPARRRGSWSSRRGRRATALLTTEREGDAHAPHVPPALDAGDGHGPDHRGRRSRTSTCPWSW